MVQPAYFLPSQTVILDITQGQYQTIVTTATDHGYNTGLYVRLVIPLARGLQALNGIQARISSVTADTFTINVPSSGLDPFVPITNPAAEQYLAQAIPISEDASTLTFAFNNSGTIPPSIYVPVPPHG